MRLMPESKAFRIVRTDASSSAGPHQLPPPIWDVPSPMTEAKIPLSPNCRLYKIKSSSNCCFHKFLFLLYDKRRFLSTVSQIKKPAVRRAFAYFCRSLNKSSGFAAAAAISAARIASGMPFVSTTPPKAPRSAW